MSKTRSNPPAAAEAAARVAEGIGEALARIVNRIESLDAERAGEQLVAWLRRVNEHIGRLERVIGGAPETTARTATSNQAGARMRPVGTQQKAPIKCGVCGTPGHNARGHAKWQASQDEKGTDDA